MLSCGFYHKTETKLETSYRHFNTFFGDPVRAQLSAAQNKVILGENLVDGVVEVGDYLKNRMMEVQKQHPKFV